VRNEHGGQADIAATSRSVKPRSSLGGGQGEAFASRFATTCSDRDESPINRRSPNAPLSAVAYSTLVRSGSNGRQTAGPEIAKMPPDG